MLELGPAVVEARVLGLAEECRRVVIVDGDRGYHVGRLAVAVAAYLSEQRYGRSLCFDVQGEAAMALTNAARCCSRLYEARIALQMAERFLENGSGDVLLRFRLANDRSSLVRALGYHQEALRTYEAGLRMARESPVLSQRDSGNLGFRVKRAIFVAELDAARGLQLQRPLLGQLREQGLSWLTYCAHTSIVDCLLNTGSYEEAHQELRRVERDHSLFASTRHNMTVLRQRTAVLRALGRFDEAWAILEELHRNLETSTPTLESTHITAELAAMAFGLGRKMRARRYAAEAVSLYTWMGAGFLARQTGTLLARH